MLGIPIVLAVISYISCEEQIICPDGTTSIPDNSNCSVYYLCQNGGLHTKVCQQGLHFNPSLKVCDRPENAGCGLEAVVSSNETVAATVDVVCRGILNGTKLVADPHDCGKFFNCGAGVAHAMVCPQGLHFNPEQEICDWPENSGCDQSITTDGTMADPWGCSDDDEGRMASDPDDCQRFLLCSHGLWISKLCPNNTHFNPSINVCDWPDSAGCATTNQSTADYATTDYPNVCEDATTDKYLVSDWSSCENFCCSNGVPILMTCPKGLHFNYEEQICDWPDNARCEVKIETRV